MKTSRLIALAIMLAALPNFALAAKKKPAKVVQEEEAEVPAKTEPKDETSSSAASSGVDPLATEEKKEEAKPTATDGKSPFPRIADEEETIYAVQRKAYLVKKKIELTPMFAATFSDRFIQTFAPAASVTYHVAENFGLEAFGAFMFPAESDLTKEILAKGKLTPEVAKLTQMLWAAGIGVQWSPIYGKLQLFGSSLGNFNFYIGAGGGLGQTRVQCIAERPLDPQRGFDPPVCPALDVPQEELENARVYEPARLQFMGTFSGGVRFYFSNSIGLKFEIKDWIFATRVFRPEVTDSTQRFTDAIRNNIFAQVGVSFLFGGEEL